MSQLRVEKVQELMKQEAGKIILYDLKDPRIGFVTVTSVEMTGDLRSAKIYVSLMGSDDQMKNTWDGLQSAVGFMRRELGQRVRLHFTPEISFGLEKSLEYSGHIQSLINRIHEEDAAHGGTGETTSQGDENAKTDAD